MHADAAAGGDQDVAVMPGILEFRQPVIGPWRGGVELGRASHGERLVRAFGVELAHEGIEPGLLLQTVETGRALACSILPYVCPVAGVDSLRFRLEDHRGVCCVGDVS